MDHEINAECAARFATMDSRQVNFDAWQKRQNGSLQRLEAKVDSMSEKLDHALERVYDRMEAKVEGVGARPTGLLTVVVSALSSGLIALLVVILTHALGGAK